MSHETSSENRRVVFIEVDGSRSEPITPRTPADMERLQKLRQKYIQAGLIPSQAPKPADSGPRQERPL